MSDTTKRLLAEFDGNYGRRGTIMVGEAECDVCKQDRACIIIDQSEDEYNAGHICGECARSATISKTTQAA